MFIRDLKQNYYEPACYAVWDFVDKKFSSASKRSDQETLSQNEPVAAPWCWWRQRVLQDHHPGKSNSEKSCEERSVQHIWNWQGRKIYEQLKLINKLYKLKCKLFFIARRSYKKISEWTFCLILRVLHFILAKRGQCQCQTYIQKRCTKNLGFQGQRSSLKLDLSTGLWLTQGW